MGFYETLSRTDAFVPKLLHRLGAQWWGASYRGWSNLAITLFGKYRYYVERPRQNPYAWDLRMVHFPSMFSSRGIGGTSDHWSVVLEEDDTYFFGVYGTINGTSINAHTKTIDEGELWHVLQSTVAGKRRRPLA